MVFDQIQCKLTTDFRNAYREGCSCTALTQMTDDWLREMYDKKIGAVLLDFSAAFDIIDHSLLLEKRMLLWLYTPCYIVDKELPV